MAYVWQHSVLRGTELVLLLAVADFANEHGIAWPGVETLATRIRADVRTTQRCIAKVEQSQELRIQRGRGPKGTHLYQVVMQANLPLFAEQQERAGGVAQRPPGKTPPRRLTTKRGGIATPPEPSGTIIKEEGRGPGKPSPVAALWKTYHHGMLERYQASPAESAKANGQLARLAKSYGPERALAIVRAYLQDSRDYYVVKRHPLELLVADAHRISIDLQGTPSGRRRCAYCQAFAIGRTGRIDHCRAHANDAIDQKPIPERTAA